MQELILNLPRWMSIWHESPSDYWFNQMYYGTHGPFKRAEAGQAITFENDKVRERGEGGLLTGPDWLTVLQVVVHGFMESDSYSPLLNISVIPQVTYRLAPAIWKKLYNYDQNLYGSGSSSRTRESESSFLIVLLVSVMANLGNLHRTRVRWCRQHHHQKMLN